MKATKASTIDPVTFEGYGPVGVEFRWDITDCDMLFEWLKTHYGTKDAERRLAINGTRMIRYPKMSVYLDEDAAVLFKMTFAGHKNERPLDF